MTLDQIIIQKILTSPNQRITFADYMELVLYHDPLGYYNNKGLKLGFNGDFFTSPHLGTDFGELLAEQLVEIWELLNKPKPYHLIEMGAGQGYLAQDIIGYIYNYYPDVFNQLQYIIIEKSTNLIKKQTKQLKYWKEIGKVQWKTFAEIPPNSIIGCCFSNELVDAFPVHLITIHQRKIQEIYITLTPDHHHLTEIIAEPSDPALNSYFTPQGINLTDESYPERYRSEVNLAALNWIKQVSQILHQGYLITIDYGYFADRYYQPSRTTGTLQCYYQHNHHNNPYINIGEQDLTAHVNFTALQQWGKINQLETIGFTKQALFLMSLGIGDRLSTLCNSNATDPQIINQILRQRNVLHELIDPMRLGQFGILIQTKGTPPRSLKGLRSC